MSCDTEEALRRKVETLEKLLEQWQKTNASNCDEAMRLLVERDEARALVRECYPWVKAGSQHGSSNAALVLKLEGLAWLRDG